LSQKWVIVTLACLSFPKKAMNSMTERVTQGVCHKITHSVRVFGKICHHFRKMLSSIRDKFNRCPWQSHHEAETCESI
jgi:hypothetical protein